MFPLELGFHWILSPGSQKCPDASHVFPKAETNVLRAAQSQPIFHSVIEVCYLDPSQFEFSTFVLSWISLYRLLSYMIRYLRSVLFFVCSIAQFNMHVWSANEIPANLGWRGVLDFFLLLQSQPLEHTYMSVITKLSQNLMRRSD
jgi:hypothetical protein